MDTQQFNHTSYNEAPSEAYIPMPPGVTSYSQPVLYPTETVPNGGSIYNQIPSIDEVNPSINKQSFDYGFINSPARIAVYDNLQSAPRVIQIPGAATHTFIEQIASLTYQNAQALGGLIPYTVIREVSENFIHANFNEVVVSILDRGNTIRFSDQGPGIQQKELVQEPGFTSATEPMKRYIRGVGSGLPIVKDYLTISHGYISIEDNVNQGSVVTISLMKQPSKSEDVQDIQLTQNESIILKALLPNKVLGVTDMHNETNISVSSIHTAFSTLEEKELVEKVNKKRTLTDKGYQKALTL